MSIRRSRAGGMCARKWGFPRSRPRKPYAPRACIRRWAEAERKSSRNSSQSVMRPGQVVIVSQEGGAICLPDLHIGIAEERPEVVEEAPEAHPLKIDEDRLPVSDHHVLRLEVPVDEDRGGLHQAPGKGRELRLQGLLLLRGQSGCRRPSRRTAPGSSPAPSGRAPDRNRASGGGPTGTRSGGNACSRAASRRVFS